jgi:hypothetical protein
VEARARRGGPAQAWLTLTILGALRLDGPAAAATVPSPTDSDVFRALVEASLVPALHDGGVVVWDNRSPHRAAGVAEAVRAAGAELMPLPRTLLTFPRSNHAGAG